MARDQACRNDDVYARIRELLRQRVSHAVERPAAVDVLAGGHRHTELIAGEIEDIPVGSDQITHEQIVAIQKIDFCRQRLVEVVRLQYQFTDVFQRRQAQPGAGGEMRRRF